MGFISNIHPNICSIVWHNKWIHLMSHCQLTSERPPWNHCCRTCILFYDLLKISAGNLFSFGIFNKNRHIYMYLMSFREAITCYLTSKLNAWTDEIHFRTENIYIVYKFYALVCFKSGFCSEWLFFFCELQTELFFSSQRNKHVFSPLTYVPNWSILQLCWLKYSI